MFILIKEKGDGIQAAPFFLNCPVKGFAFFAKA